MRVRPSTRPRVSIIVITPRHCHTPPRVGSAGSRQGHQGGVSGGAGATDREGVRWTWALIAVTLMAGPLRAGPALHPNPYLSADERGYTNVATRLAETGRYGRESLHWPPGAPGAFAVAMRAGVSPYWAQWLAGT